MRKPLLLALTFLLAAAFVPAPASAAARKWGEPSLRTGDKRARQVRDAQYLLRGNNPFRIGTYKGPVDGRYGIGTRRAVSRMKYKLGYPARALRAPQGLRFGRDLYRYLTGGKPLPKPYQVRKARRWRAERYGYTGVGVVARVGGCASYPPQTHVLAYWREVAAAWGRPLVCTSGARPWRRNVLGGGVSDHYTGNAADISTPTRTMNLALARVAARVAGMPAALAARITHPSQFGWRIYGRAAAGVNLVFNCVCFGDHLYHVHGGLRSWRGLPYRSGP